MEEGREREGEKEGGRITWVGEVEGRITWVGKGGGRRE